MRSQNSDGPQFSSLAHPGTQLQFAASSQYWPGPQSEPVQRERPVRDGTTHPGAGACAVCWAHGSQRPTAPPLLRTQVSRGPQSSSLAQPGRQSGMSRSSQYIPALQSWKKHGLSPVRAGPGHIAGSASGVDAGPRASGVPALAGPPCSTEQLGCSCHWHPDSPIVHAASTVPSAEVEGRVAAVGRITARPTHPRSRAFPRGRGPRPPAALGLLTARRVV